MRTILLALFMFFTTTAHAEDGWFPYYFPADPAKAADYQGVPASVFNAGKDVLDPPAGSHGFVTARDGHFYFADGTRARFWGTNLCFDACFPDKKQAQIMANRIAYFGFNAVRFTHMDYYFEPKGIFEDVCPAYKDPQMKQTGVLSKKQLDKLDYFIFQLKQRGIYININTLVARFFTEADGVPDAAKLGMAAKSASLFDAKLIALQKQYAKDLLTHYNPYTKLRYCDDPAICMVEINNENSLVDLKPSTLPEYYLREYNMLLDLWLAGTGKKTDYDGPQINLLPDIASWGIEQHAGAVMSKNIGDSTETGFKPIPQEIALNITNITPTAWHLQFRCTGIHLKKDKNYLLKFAAKGLSPKGPVPIAAVSQQAYDPWNNLGLSESFNLTKEYQTFEAPFTAIEDCDNARVGFIVGYTPGAITIKDATLCENAKAAEIKEFKVYLEEKYLKEMRAYLRNEVGVKVPIGIGCHWNPAQLKLQEDCLDYVDRHNYWDHPTFLNNSWDMNNFRIQNKSIFSDPNQGILGVITTNNVKTGHRPTPCTFTEWNHCYPNLYAYETPLLLAQKSRQNNWDALFQFDFSGGGLDAEKKYDDIHGFFDINSNAQQLILCSFASRIFLGSVTPPTVSITKEYAIINYGKYTIKVGPIKNTNSRWNSEGKFEWGNAPTMLKNNH